MWMANTSTRPPFRRTRFPCVQVIAQVDLNPVQPPKPVPSNQFQLLDTYATLKYAGLDFSVGKQSMWWGPGESGALLMSNNAAPFWMMHINRTEPTYIPLLSKFLGPFEADNFFGSLAGHEFPVGPYFFGQKVSFKPTENLEFGFTRDDVFGGQGHVPITFGSFWTAFTSFNDVPPPIKFSRNDPGARHASFDFSYRLPFLRRWLTIVQRLAGTRRCDPGQRSQALRGQSGHLSHPCSRRAQARLPRRGGLHRSSHPRQYRWTLHLLGGRVSRPVSQQSLPDGELDWP